MTAAAVPLIAPDEDHFLACPLTAWQGDSHRCRWCNRPLPPRAQRWCSPGCLQDYRDNHVWDHARPAALSRSCDQCDSRRRLEVHHMIPKRGKRTRGCQHHQRNLRTLCRDCHKLAHNVMRGVKDALD